MNEKSHEGINDTRIHTGIRAMLRAKAILEEHINNKSDFSDDEALHLGYEYVQRWFEEIFFVRDHDHIFESMRSSGETRPDLVTDNLLRHLGSALFLAQQGEYAQLKQVLQEQGDHLIKEFSRSSLELDQRQVRVGRSLIKFAESMQLNGDPIYLLTPAWMDPRFNGDLE